jgi:hypothetical protein
MMAMRTIVLKSVAVSVGRVFEGCRDGVEHVRMVHGRGRIRVC